MAQANDVIDLTAAGGVLDKHVTSGEIVLPNTLVLDIDGGGTVEVNLSSLEAKEFAGKAWVNDHEYIAGDIVSNGIMGYICTHTNTGYTPSFNSDYWIGIVPLTGTPTDGSEIMISRIGWTSVIAEDNSDSTSQHVFDLIDENAYSYTTVDLGSEYLPDVKKYKRHFVNLTEEGGEILNPAAAAKGEYGKFIMSQGRVPVVGTFFDTAYKFNQAIPVTIKPYITYIVEYEVYDENIIYCTVTNEFYLPYGANTCIMIGDNGTKNGYSPTFGTVKPEVFSSGQKNYEVTWQASGTVVVRAGVAGDEKINGVSNVYVYTGDPSEIIELPWDETTLMYEGNDTVTTAYLLANYSTGEEVCLGVYPVPDLLIEYDMTISIGA